MKTKLFIFLSFCLLLSCSNDDGPEDPNNAKGDTEIKEGKLSPPSWIQGKWECEIGGNMTLMVEFRKDTYIYGQGLYGTVTGAVNFKEVAKLSNTQISKAVLFESIKNANTYEAGIRITANGTTTEVKYRFDRVSDTEIRHAMIDSEHLTFILKKK